MADLILNTSKGGGVRPFSFSATCNVDCNACYSTLPAMPKKVNVHEHPWATPNWDALAPRLNGHQKDCIAADEVGTVGVKQVPAGYTIWSVWVPPYSILRSVGINNLLYKDDYGNVDTSMDGMIYDLVANEVDETVCPPVIGAAVPAAVPAAGFTGIVAATAGVIIGSVSPATGGYETAAKGVVLSLKIAVPPTGGLSNMKGEITLQANIETFNALIR